jgi:hypothetical protein
MTDRTSQLVVVLEEDLRVDDAESILAAIRQLRGVASAEANVIGTPDYVANVRAKLELAAKVREFLKP